MIAARYCVLIVAVFALVFCTVASPRRGDAGVSCPAVCSRIHTPRVPRKDHPDTLIPTVFPPGKVVLIPNCHPLPAKNGRVIPADGALNVAR